MRMRSTVPLMKFDQEQNDRGRNSFVKKEHAYFFRKSCSFVNTALSDIHLIIKQRSAQGK